MTTPAAWEVIAGEVGATGEAELTGVADLTDVDTIWALVWRESDDEATDAVQLDVDILDAVDRTVTVHWGDADGWLATAEHGTWLLRFHADWVTGGAHTVWPRKRRPCTVLVSFGGRQPS